MLVLSRKLGQRFQIGQDIRVTIVKIDRNSVRIGIEAPGDVTVYREEIVPAVCQSEVESGTASVNDPEPARSWAERPAVDHSSSSLQGFRLRRLTGTRYPSATHGWSFPRVSVVLSEVADDSSRRVTLCCVW